MLQAKKRELNNRKDLGAIFNDGTLNLQYVEPDSGEINPIFTYTEEAGSLKVRCELCNLQVVGKTSLDTHRDGKKHKANIEKYEMSSKLKKSLIFTKFSDFTKFSLNFYFPYVGADVPPPGEEALIPREPIIFKVFDQFREAPLIGLEYIVEIIHGPNVDPTYECLLCKTTLRANDVLSCVISAKHRLNYLVSSAFECVDRC